MRNAMIVCAALGLLATPAGAEERQAGGWFLRWETSASDGKTIVIATAPAQSPSSNDPAYLTIRCIGSRTEFFTGTTGAWGLPKRPFRVSWRIEGGAAGDGAWDVSTNGKAAFLSAGIEDFLRGLPDDGRLTISVADPQGQAFETTFALAGIGEVRAKTAEACGWKP